MTLDRFAYETHGRVFSFLEVEFPQVNHGIPEAIQAILHPNQSSLPLIDRVPQRCRPSIRNVSSRSLELSCPLRVDIRPLGHFDTSLPGRGYRCPKATDSGADTSRHRL